MSPSWLYFMLLLPPFIIKVGSREFCLTDTFSAQCPPGAVLIIDHAQFGRIRIGRCVEYDYGNLGCAEDVRAQLDSVCSGRPSCELSVSDPVLVRTKPCPMDLTSYLEAAYSCVQVVQAQVSECNAEGYELPGRVGFLSSFHDTPCPVYMRLAPAQRLNLTLYDFSGTSKNFSRGKEDISDSQVSSGSHDCPSYAVVEETQVGSSVTLCGGGQRIKRAYKSRTNYVTIRLISPPPAVFLIKYQVVGCPEPVLPLGSHARYEDDVLFVFCNITGTSTGNSQAAILTCVDGQWQGILKNCTYVSGRETSGEHEKERTSYGGLPPVGISIVIIFGVALVIVVYVGIMIVCVLFIRRRRRRRLAQQSGGQTNKDRISTGAECIDDKHHNHMTHTHHSPPRGAHEERLPMLFKPNNIRQHTGPGSEYTDFCELHDIKSSTLVDLGPIFPAARTLTNTGVYDTANFQNRRLQQPCSKTAQIDRTRLYESAHIIRSNNLDRGDSRSHICLGDYGECLSQRNQSFTTGPGPSGNPDILPGEDAPTQNASSSHAPSAVS